MRVIRQRFTSSSLGRHHLHSRKLPYERLLEKLETNVLCRYTRSEIPRKGGKPRVMEQHSQTTDEFTYSMYASQEGTYEVTSIEDKYCSYSAKGRK